MEQEKAGTRRSRRFVWLRLAVSLVLLLLVFYRIEEPAKTFEYLQSAHFGFLALAIGLALGEVVYGAYKWLILLRCKLPRLGLGPVVKVQFLSSFLGQFLPGGGMDVIKIYGLARATRDLAFSFTSLLMDRLIGLLPLLLVVLVGLTLESRVQLPLLRSLTIAALLLFCVGSVAVMNPRFRRLTDRILVLEVLRDKSKKVYASLDTFRGRPGVLTFAIVLAIGTNLLRVAVVMATAKALGIHITWIALLFIVPCVVFVMLLPISLAGWGVRELTFVWFLQLYGIPGEQALALSLLIGLTGLIVSLPGAPLFVTGLHRVPVDLETEVAEESPEPLEQA